uniref:RING-type domain-containing protein n=1 Tax=Neobodo designis TaxID=312471 RepID=A0A7S1PZZ0_NEODS|mmetsp:Transcript_27761/g.86036  ORF Transcript_27761/g.86036 Transcript_27761/m.86036 type:complete len:176 (+) Transcript_27761:35-562(+)
MGCCSSNADGVVVRTGGTTQRGRAPFVRQHTAEEAAEAFGLTRAESLEFTSACVICIAAPRRVALVPCGHFCLCEECLPLQARMKWCPMCRADFTAGLRVIVPPVPAGKAAETSCSGCGQKPRTHAAMPCGHLVLCGDCADGGAGAPVCPECEKQAISWHRIFMLPANPSNVTAP